VDRWGGRTTEVIVLSPSPEIMELADGFPRRRPAAGKDIAAAAREQRSTRAEQRRD